MNNEKNKIENRKALKVYIPFLIVMAVVGGIIGLFSTTDAAQRWTVYIEDAFNNAVYVISPWAVVGFTAAGMIIAAIYYKRGRELYNKSLGEQDDDVLDEMFRKVDINISKVMMAINVCEILSMIFFAATIAYIEDYIKDNKKIYIMVLVVFVAGNFIRVKMQQMAVDFVKIMNPEKNGSVYDLSFQKKWEDSCDEFEMFTRYKAAYKAYRTSTLTCLAMFTILLILNFFFEYGPLPNMAVGVIWLVSTVGYCREAMKIDKEKIN